MREKLIDSALLAGMVIICVVILYTLFSPSSRTPRELIPPPTLEDSAGDATEDTNEVAPAEADDLSVETPPDTPDGAEADIVPVSPLEDSEEDASEAASPTESEGVDADFTEQDAPSSAEEPPTSEADNSENEVGPTDTPSEEAATAEDAVEETSPPATANDDVEAAPEPPPIPSGTFELERVGFSFVTGGAGACGITLEAWQHIAVSRDILERYPCGSEVTLTLTDPVAGRTQLTAIVADTMNPANVRTVNIYVGADEPALEYGVNGGRFAP